MNHKTNGPVYEFTQGWYLRDKAHRYYGPAFAWDYWFIHDKRVK